MVFLLRLSVFDALKMRQNDAAAHLRIKHVPGTGSSRAIFAVGLGRNIGKKLETARQIAAAAVP